MIQFNTYAPNSQGISVFYRGNLSKEKEFWSGWNLDWFKRPVDHGPLFKIAREGQSVTLEGLWHLPTVGEGETQARGGFKEGLWEGPVLELFLSWDQPQMEKYVEIHLSPWGEWWFCEFSRYRVRSPLSESPQAFDVVTTSRTEKHMEGDSMLASSVTFTPKDSSPFLGIGEDHSLRGNITAMHWPALAHPFSGAPHYADQKTAPEPQYLSWSPPRTDTPDFHRTDNHLPFVGVDR